MSWLRKELVLVREAARDFTGRVVKEPSLRLMAGLGLVVMILSLAVWHFESLDGAKYKSGDGLINTFSEAVYWMFISGTTTGYGDLTPHTPWGRTITVVIILISMALTSVLTATIASWFVERRIMEGRGMEKINWRDHIVICGWNVHAAEVVKGIYRDTRDDARVVLINNLAEDLVSQVLYEYKRQGLRFVRGDFVHEVVLQRANVPHAHSVVILADGTADKGYTGADQRTVLAALAIKSMNPGIKVSAELIDEENVPHLRRAQVDHVVVLGENIDFLLSSSVTSPGVTLAVQELLSRRRGAMIQQVRVPSQLVDQSFGEAFKHFREKQGALLIGLVCKEETGMNLNDILSDDLSAIDLFIKTQFEGIEQDYFFKGSAMKVRLNPPDDYKIHKNDRALIIGEPGAGGGVVG